MSQRDRTLIGLILVALMFYFENKTRCNNDRSYLNALNLYLVGTVEAVDAVHGHNEFDVVKVKIINTNLNYYDPRGKYEYYYCIIKNGYAELYQIAGREASVGDTIIVDSKKRTFTIKKSKGDIVEDILINSSKKYYEYLSTNHQKF